MSLFLFFDQVIEIYNRAMVLIHIEFALCLTHNCRCRHGYFHVVNNDYSHWEMYAIGGSAAPTINSQGNRFLAPNDNYNKEVMIFCFSTILDEMVFAFYFSLIMHH